jgi:hypothetical protein
MTERILYLTKSTFDFSQVDPTSQLITKVQENLPPGTYHTSLGDLTVAEIIHIAAQFNHIKFEYQGFDCDSDVYRESLSLYKYLIKHSISPVIETEQFTDHSGISNRSTQPTLWVFGCSHSHGVGLRPNELNYGQLLSRSLNMPLKLITKPGSSLHWSYRHLFNSPISPQDIVIWQLTTPGRVSKFNGKQVNEFVLNNTKDRKLIDSITLEQLYFTQISFLNTGVRFLQALKCKFILTSIINFGSDYDYVSEYVKYPEYCSNYGLHLDYGTDGIHAGPLSHQAIAQRLSDHIQ